MAETKYTEEQLQNAEELVSILKSLPEDKRSTVVMMANSFIAGISIIYKPEYHFSGAAPSKDDLVDAERMSQEEFDRKLRRWMKDHDRKDF